MLAQSAKRRFATVVSTTPYHILQYKNYINGKWVESKGPKKFEILNPVRD